MRQAIALILVIILFIGNFITANSAAPADSTGMVTESGRTFVIHTVEKGETLYSLSRRYGVDLQQVMSANPGTNQGLKIGATLKIPYSSKDKSGSTATKGATHTVKKGETLYSISRKYGVSVEELRGWNNLSGNSLDPGQVLRIGATGSSGAVSAPKSATDGKVHVVKPSETLYSISKMYDTSPAQIKSLNSLQSNDLKIGQKLIVSSAALPQTSDPNPSSMLPSSAMVQPDGGNPTTAENSKAPAAVAAPKQVTTRDENRNYTNTEKVTERGLAEVIEDSEDTRKYLALHRTAPMGTIMQIRNEMNDQIVFVRVVGSVPDTGDNDKILVKISKKAFDRLGAVDKRFPIELSYIP